MLIADKIYGDFTIASPAALELIATAAFARLKGVAQFGIPDQYHCRAGFSRYDHSVGVYILLNKLGASEEEQIAGLLHDISHTAFSHLVDWVLESGPDEDYQDRTHLAALSNPEIAAILARHGHSHVALANLERFSLLERDTPDLCADRVDYVLRESDPRIAAACLPQLASMNGRMVFTDQNSAAIFARNFLDCQMNHWGGYEAVTRYSILGDMLKAAIKNNDLAFEDLLLTDDHAIQKIIATGKKEYLKVLELLENKNLDFLPKAATPIVKKFRHVDPLVVSGVTAISLSEIDADFKNELEAARTKNAKGIYPGIFKLNFFGI